jgi:hypothetical protein
MQGHRWYSFDNGQIPEPGASAGLIAPFWDDLEYAGNNGVFRYNDTANHRFIIEWKNCTHPQAPGALPETFQMIIHDPAYYPTPTGDSEILFQYEVVNNNDNDSYNPLEPGCYSSVGFQSIDNMDGLQYEYDNLYHPAAAILQATRAIKITTATGLTPPPDIDYSPSSYFVNAQGGQIIMETLFVENTGFGSLVFNLYAVSDSRLASTGDSGDQKIISAPQPVGYESAADVKPLDIGQPIFPPSILSQGGPDTYGNHWIDSDEPGGPAANWVDISSVGTPITGLSDDNFAGPFNIGFSFLFYGSAYSQVYVSSNGFLSFDSGQSQFTNQNIPNIAVPNNMIDLFWDDLIPGVYGSVYYYHDIANNRFIVSYVGVPIWNTGDTGTGFLDLEAILYPNGRILLQYGNLDPGVRTLTSCTVGIEDVSGSDGLQVVWNAAYLHSNMAILFVPPSRWLYSNLSGAILPSGADTFAVITFDATALGPGVYTGHLDIESNDPDESGVSIPLTLTVGSQGAPDISFSPSSVLDSLVEGEFAAIPFHVYNDGTANLIVDLTAVEFNVAPGGAGSEQIAGANLEAGRDGDDEIQDIMNTWFFITPATDTIPPNDSLTAIITLDARFVGAGNYLGQVQLESNDPDSPNNTAPVTLVVYSSGPNCQYIPGDINGNGDANGIDVTFGVSYFKGGASPPYSCDCQPVGVFFVAGDVNGNCTFNGIDITYFVGFLKGTQPQLNFCSSCPPSRQLHTQPRDGGAHGRNE